MILTSTIVAPATIPGSGAISIIRMSGGDTFAVLDQVVKFRNGTASASAGYTLKYGVIEGLDDVLVSIFRAPHSYTGEDSAEISCHASAYIVSEITNRLMEAGAVPAEAGEFTRRAFVNGRMDLSQAEAVADLIASSDEASHHVALHQLRGGISSELQELRSKLLEVTSLMELELDFSEEEVEFADRAQLSALIDSALAHIKRLTESFRLGNAIKNGVPVAIVGATNTGKSTLLNSLLGEERAIVSSVAGTTRDTIEELFNIDGTSFRFIDTAGIRETSDEIETIGIDRTFEKLLLADVVIAVLDVTSPASVIESELRTIISKITLSKQHLVVVLNKIDKFGNGGSKQLFVPVMDEIDKLGNGGLSDDLRDVLSSSFSGHENAKILENEGILVVNKIVTELNNSVKYAENKVDIVMMSAKTGFGVDSLKKVLSDCQKSRIADSGTATLVTNARHYNALCSASRALKLAASGIASGTSGDLVSQDLREALYHLGSITGSITTDEVLGNIFSKFCIGK
ncbi:MAG: tRNA uridine-5-carboxymethylaminomethyl(34) synthesis GTPase MnmE [Bacteroidia bacterium]|nr:tRNA uridine-5-carboxymethylaminomethyl(34) synthesis GTPase MnmE [Bacteroidia bacterium]